MVDETPKKTRPQPDDEMYEAPTILGGKSPDELTAQQETLDTPTIAGADTEKRLATKPDSPKPGESQVCQTFGRFELLQELGRGGMGVVFRAKETPLNRTVALKMVIAGELAGTEELQRFRAEAEAAAQLNHSGIVPIYEIGSVGKQYYYTMGYVEGENLESFVKKRSLDFRTIAEIAFQTANAVAYAHERGIVHRDLKPENILMDDSCQPKITDFGLAKRMDMESALTRTGQILGTPGYMAPEQAAGESKTIGAPSDIYAIGGILFFMLTGRPPFQASNVIDTLVQVLEKDAPSPRRFRRDTPRSLEQICLRCLERRPEHRYRSAAELAQDLDRYLQGVPTLAKPPTFIEKLPRLALREPALSVHVTSLLLLLVISNVIYVVKEGISLFGHLIVSSLLIGWLFAACLIVVLGVRFQRQMTAQTVLLCFDSVMLSVLLGWVTTEQEFPGPMLIGYPLLIVSGATFCRVRLVVLVTAASLCSYVGLIIARPFLLYPVHQHVVFVILQLGIAACLIHQVRRVRALSDYFQVQRTRDS